MTTPEDLLRTFVDQVAASPRRPLLETGQSANDFPSRVPTTEIYSLNAVVSAVYHQRLNSLTNTYLVDDLRENHHFNVLEQAVQAAAIRERFNS
jgi:hypothetical protein